MNSPRKPQITPGSSLMSRGAKRSHLWILHFEIQLLLLAPLQAVLSQRLSLSPTLSRWTSPLAKVDKPLGHSFRAEPLNPFDESYRVLDLTSNERIIARHKPPSTLETTPRKRLSNRESWSLARLQDQNLKEHHMPVHHPEHSEMTWKCTD